MKQKYLKTTIAICLFFSTFFTFSQNTEEIKTIQKKTNLNELKNLEIVFKQKSIQEKNKALTLAQINGWPLTYSENGSFHELIKVTEDNKPIYYKTFNVDAATSTRANYLHNGGGLGLDLEGQGMTAHVWDGGLARGTHQEFDGIGGDNRFTIGDNSTTLNFHASHVTGTIMASGFVASAKGMAPQALGVGYDWNSDESEVALAASNGMLVSNHSYGFNTGAIPDSWFGAYISDARNMDIIMHDSPYYLQVSAAGNDGNNNTSNGNPLEGNAAFDKIAGFQASKNGLTVANGQDASIDTDGSLISVVRNSGSSEGPMDDLRIKPDIMGNGTGLTSTYEGADDDYGTISGTSMASPNVTGSLLLLQQHYNNINSQFMRASTLKGLALHTADNIGDAGPDAQQGWGLMNTKKAAETITANGTSSFIKEEVLAEGETYTLTVKSNGLESLFASISWTDSPGNLASGTANDNTPALVNDLDIRVTQNTDTFEPWKLTSVNTNAKGDNFVDPYERVDVEGASGDYTITVTHKGTLVDGPQSFSLIITGVVSDFSFTTANSSVNQCSTSNAEFNFDYIQAIPTTTSFSFANLPNGASASFSSSSLSADDNFTFTVSGLENVASGTYEIDVIGDNGSEVQTRKVNLRVLHPDFADNPMNLTYPANEEKGILFPDVTLTWDENINAESYTVEVSNSPSFTNILTTSTQTELEYSLSNLVLNTIYYWRVIPSNQCGVETASEIFSFQTSGSEDCSNTYSATDFSNSQIFLNNNNTATVPIEIPDGLTISRLIVGLDISHPALEEINVFVQEPASLGANTIILLNNECNDVENITNATFDDTGFALVCGSSDPAVTGSIIPFESLSSPSGKNSLGTWIIGATDTVLFNGGGATTGNIDSASITVCTAQANTSVPDFVNNGINVIANGSYTFQTTDIEASSTTETAAQQLYTIVALPSIGNITLNSVNLLIGDTFTQEDVNLGNVAFSNTETALFSDSFKVDITNAINGWLPNQNINLVATSLSSSSFDFSGFSVYPNPSNGIINIKFQTENNSQISLELFDLTGRRVYNSIFESNQTVFDESVNIGNIANGIYLLKATQGNRSTTKRIIISK